MIDLVNRWFMKLLKLLWLFLLLLAACSLSAYVLKCKEEDECGREKIVEHPGFYYREIQSRLPGIVKRWTEYNMKHEPTMGPKKK